MMRSTLDRSTAPLRILPPRRAAHRLRRSRALLGPVLVLLAVLAGVAEPAIAATAVKVATLAPDGSVWDKTLRTMGDRWRSETGGEVTLRLYPGGVAGDEPDIVRKMNIGQLHGAALTSGGLATIDPALGAFQLPMLFESYDELFHVLETLRPTIDQRLAERGYVLLSWGHGGWLHLFSTEPVRAVADLEKLKIFTWSGDDEMADRWRRNGFDPVPLAATDILTGLNTGMINALPTTPLAALSLQWFRHTPYMQDFGVAPLIGATVIHRRVWAKLSSAERDVMRAAAADAEATLRREVPDQDKRAITAMTSRGLKVVEVPAEHSSAWQGLAARFAEDMRKHSTAKDLIEAISQARDAYRAQASAGGAGGH